MFPSCSMLFVGHVNLMLFIRTLSTSFIRQGQDNQQEDSDENKNDRAGAGRSCHFS